MEFADLGSLHKYIKDTSLAQQTVPVRTRVAFLHQVSLGMKFLHQQRIHHHDLKSKNVLLTQASSSEIIAKISDFGLSRMVEGGLTRITGFNQHGSLFWKAPERHVWRPVSSPKSDVFSFAVLLTEIILWSWRGVYGFTFEYLQKNSFEPNLCRDSDFRADVFTNMDETCFFANVYSPYGPQIRSIFERCWAVFPNDRPDFEEVSQDLGRLLGYEAAMDNGTANTGSPNLVELLSAGIRGAGAVQAEEEIQIGVAYRNGTLSPRTDHPAMSSGRQDEERNLAADMAISLQISTEGGNSVSQKNLGLLYLNGRGVPKDPSMAAHWFRKAAEQGNAAAQNNLGLMYRNGNGVLKNLAETLHWFQEAANQGDPDGLHNLGILYSDGEGVAQDLAQAAAWFRKAAQKGHAQSQANLGILHKHGQGVQRDLAAAAHWFKKAADQGNTDGLTHLGFLYRDGDGVPMDLCKAADLFQKAAEKGDANAQSELHFLYLSGRGVPKDPAKAFYWAQKSAQQGSAAGQNNLGVLYHYGTGVEKNPSMAAHYFRKAMEQGHKGALDNLAKLALSTNQQ
ncbi:hypothetical protein DFJ73DRAFT_868777 [Zopfochytrium polystomum]|nr:hypothetical protein DFJ73DRAFT_868777 [Zopfochytrium polystomum]